MSEDTFNKQGAEARIYTANLFENMVIVKERFPKTYRLQTLDKNLRTARTRSEVKCMVKCRSAGIPTPCVYLVDTVECKIYMEFLKDTRTLKDYICSHVGQGDSKYESLSSLAGVMGAGIGKIHKTGVVHGDLTTSNMLIRNGTDGSSQKDVIFIDFGLSYVDSTAEDRGVDLYVLERALLSTHPDSESFFSQILAAYTVCMGAEAAAVVSKLEEVRMRGRKRTMVG